MDAPMIFFTDSRVVRHCSYGTRGISASASSMRRGEPPTSILAHIRCTTSASRGRPEFKAPSDDDRSCRVRAGCLFIYSDLANSLDI